MNDSIAILGRQPALGLAELERLYGGDNVTPLAPDRNVARISRAPTSIDFARLGGTVKLGTMLTALDTTNWKEVERYLIRTLPDRARHLPAGKMHLGISAYGLGISSQQLLATGLRLKKAIRADSGRTVRLVPNKSAELNTAQVLHNKLTDANGCEVVLVRDHEQTIVAQTVFVQDIESYGRRDFGRPKRDARVGMLPPKLAQIIVNLATGPLEPATVAPRPAGDASAPAEGNLDQHAGSIVLDPFCGTGVVLQEALLMGYRAYGTDVEPRMITYTQSNLDWLADQYSLPSSDYRLSVGDATNLTWQSPIGAVASEIYLGRPFTAPPTAEVLAQTVSDCNLIAKKFLQNIHGQLRTRTHLCLAVPAWRIGQGTFRHLPLIDHLPEMGYNRVSLQHVRDHDLLYFREDQIVARQLLLITRN